MASLSSLMASSTSTPFLLFPSSSSSLRQKTLTLIRTPRASFPLLPAKPFNLPSSPILLPTRRIRASISSATTSSSSVLSPQVIPESPPEILSGSTRTLATLFALALSLSRVFMKLAHRIPLPVWSEQLAGIMSLQRNSISTMGPLFFAALRDRPAGSLNTPLTVVAAGLAKWLDIYSGVLMVRVLLSWFPNIPWERQPLSAIRDLCDPYLNLFRNIIPPVFDTLDVSPLLAFAVLGTLGSILHGSTI